MNWMQKMAQQKILFIARGPSGSGKSTMVKELADKTGAQIFGSDDFFMRDGVYQFDLKKLSEAHEWNRSRVEEAMQGEVPYIIVDNTNTMFWEMQPYALLAQQYGYEVQFKEPDWHSELKPGGKWNVDFLERMQHGSDRDKGKFISRDILQRMVDRYQYNPTVPSVIESERPVFRR